MTPPVATGQGVLSGQGVVLFVATAVIAVWAVLLGLAYLSRVVLGFGIGRSIGVVACAYAVLGTLTVERLGATVRGLLGVAGMAVPLAVACLLIAITGRRR